MAEFAQPWGKVGHPPVQFGKGTVLAFYYTVKLLQLELQRAKKCNSINLTYGLSELVLQNTK